MNGNEPAFPFPSGPEPRHGEFHERWEGMTYRQWLAGKALAAIVSNPSLTGGIHERSLFASSKDAVALADALIARLNETPAKCQ